MVDVDHQQAALAATTLLTGMTPDFSGAVNPSNVVLLDLNPQAISLSEPIQTAVSYTQGGGKFIESRGGVLKNFTVSGTTGLLLPGTLGVAANVLSKPSAGGLFDSLRAEDQAKRSGFKAFYELRLLFRRFMLERRLGKKILMHWLDFKADEFWLIEPKSFDMQRDKGAPFLYRYNISFVGIEPSEDSALRGVQGRARQVMQEREGAAANRLAASQARLPGQDISSVKAALRLRQMRSNLLQFVVGRDAGVAGRLKLTLQRVLANMNEVVGIASDINTIRRTLVDLPLTLYRQLLSSIAGAFNILEDLQTGFEADVVGSDVNEFLVEARFLTEGLLAHHQRLFASLPAEDLLRENQKFTTPRGRTGTTGQLIQEPDEGSAVGAFPLDEDPFFGGNGLDLIGDVQKIARSSVMRPEIIHTGDNIFDLAQRLMGDVNMFVFLILLNRLNPPYIVSSATDKPPSTLAWGETILVPTTTGAKETSLAGVNPVDPGIFSFSGNVSDFGSNNQVVDDDRPDTAMQWRVDQWVGFTVELLDGAGVGEKRVVVANTEDVLTVNRPWTLTPSPGDAYRVTLEIFSKRRAVSAEAQAYGFDLLAKFPKLEGGLVSGGGVDLVLSGNKDLAIVRGVENFSQAILLRLHTEQNSNKLHPTYGVGLPIGRPMTPELQALYTFLARGSLFDDPRVDSVNNPQLTFEDGTLRFDVEIKPVKAQARKRFRIAA
jgi:hypothetical protein